MITKLCISIFLSFSYLAAAVGWFVIWRRFGANAVLKEKPILYIPYVVCPLNFIINGILVFWEQFPDYATERIVYDILMNNARVVATLALAVGIFVRIGVQTKFMKQFLSFIALSFVFAVAGVLPIYWQPQIEYTLTTLRHLKTIPYTYSLYCLTTAILCFINFKSGKSLKHILNDSD